MTSVLAILGFAVLFGVFGLLAPAEEGGGCGGGSCALEKGGEMCGSCPHEGSGWNWKKDGTAAGRGSPEIER